MRDYFDLMPGSRGSRMESDPENVTPLRGRLVRFVSLLAHLATQPAAVHRYPQFTYLTAVLVTFSLGGPVAWATETGLPQEPIQFDRDVLPILSENCFACHGFDAEARQGGLRLDTEDGSVGESDSGLAAIVRGNADESELMRRIMLTDDGEQMPPPESEKKLSDAQREILRRWINDGGVYSKHWSFTAPSRPTTPDVEGVTHPVDRFIQTRLRKAGIEPSPRASDVTIIRRVSLDLIGLPPTSEEVSDFLQATAVDPDAAYSALVERLLQSPHYGERWARWWLDQARYADSNGYSIDGPREIWHFRDWVIDALNTDMPFDQFTIEQLAGDLLPAATQSQKVATGFHRNTQINQEGGIDREQFRIDSVFDRVATTGTVWLGLTIGCAQCHDHKFDPISQAEYYQLFAFFNNQEEPTMKVYAPSVDAGELIAELKTAEAEVDDYIAGRSQDYDAWEASLTDEEKSKLAAGLRQSLDIEPGQRKTVQRRELFAIEVGKTDSEYQARLQRMQKLDGQVNGVATTMVMQELATPRQTTILIKGDFTRPADVVEPGTPAVLPPLDVATDEPVDRLALARWITSEDNPLTARVIVNRVWQVYFGRGLVETENDFGTLGTLPSHPELLDSMALDFREQGWSLKELHRQIVTSQTYLQSSAARDDLVTLDPHNYLLARQQRIRLDAELVRDVSLAASGLLSRKFGGPPVFPPIPAGAMNTGQVSRGWDVSQGEDRFRRGLYTFVYRATPPPSLNVFDAPDGFSTCTRRSRSNTPLQALTLLNDSSFFEFAEALEIMIQDDGLKAAFLRCTSREPTSDELAVLRRLDPQSAARVLLNLDETMTRE